MNPEQIEALLGLDPARVAAAAGATEDYARLLGAGELEPLELDATADAGDVDQQALCVASAFTTAASLWMLLDAHRAAYLFNAAADVLPDGAGSADVLRICAHPRDAPVTQPFVEWERRTRSPEATVLSLLTPLAGGRIPPSEVEAALGNLPEVSARPRATPTGKLRLPLGLYLDVLFEVANIRSEQVEPERPFRVAATEAYLARVAEMSSLARADRYHWAMPGIGLLPVEPEAIATCALVDVAMRDVLDRRLSEVIDVADGLTAAPALVAVELVSATDGTPEPGRTGAGG